MHLPDRYRNPIIGIILIFTLANGFFLSQLQIDFQIEQLFPKGDDDLLFYQNQLKSFHSDEEYLLIGIENISSIYNHSFLSKLAHCTDSLNRHPFIQSASSITSAEQLIINPFLQPSSKPFLRWNDPKCYPKDSLFINRYPDVKEKFISPDNQAICMYVRLKDSLSDRQGQELLYFLRNTLDFYAFDRYHFSGKIDTQQTYLEAIQSELMILSLLSLGFIVLILYLTFRTFWGVIIPLFITVLAVCWTLGTLTACGGSINIMTAIIPPIIMVVALSDVIHLMARFHEQLQLTIDRKLAIQIALRDIGIAILLTSITTAIGFLSLTYADIQPFIEFGLFTAVGVIYAWILTITLLPVLLNMFPHLQLHKGVSRVSRYEGWASRAFAYTHRYPWLIMLLALILIGGSLYGISQLKNQFPPV